MDREPRKHRGNSFKTRLAMLSAATRVLRQSLSTREFLGVLSRYIRAGKASTWKSLPPPADEKDSGSRDQLGDAIRIHDALSSRLDRDRVLAITRDVVKAGAIEFLRGTLPVVSRQDIERMGLADRLALLEQLVAAFPNADGKVVAVNADEFTFRVTRCRFPELLGQLGRAELAGAFCSGDLEYFQRFQPDIEASRDSTIAAGGDCCGFTFRLKP
ncbi:MAG: L-2-amino-thiazoline-4-carboxylic acid hydrolase [Candidatus Lokiarchaeota archaeon]|nr:L-2-amino-thiazoline-4-carboxylic acid hydrolase [Candidatus Lokiarchaeota archaeon]